MSEPNDLLLLLKSWKLLELLPHLRDEGIGIDELLLMKHHHITELLQNHKLGVRVRFEHHFERWRRELHKPLLPTHNQSVVLTQHNVTPVAAAPAGASTAVTAQVPQIAKFIALESRATNTEPVMRRHVATNTSDLAALLEPTTRTTITPPLTLVPIPMPKPMTTAPMPTQAPATTLVQAQVQTPVPVYTPATPSMSPNVHAPRDAISPPLRRDLRKQMPKLTPQPALLLEGTASAGATVGMPVMSTAASPKLSPPQLSSGYAGFQDARTNPHTLTNKNDERIPLSLLQILSSSGTKGTSLLEYYQQHKELRNNHRMLLIQLIVNYFDMNDYHLSLNVSHSLEEQILRMFPTEKLEYYRTEKRGKIYVKFCNMKRYKRDRSTLKRKFDFDVHMLNDVPFQEVETMNVSVDIDDFAALSYDDWPNQQPQIEMTVKTETLSEDDAQ